MKDMIPKGTGNSRFLRSVGNFKVIYPTYDDFVNALVAGNLPVDFNGINDAGIQQVGTPLNKANLLTDETAAALGLTGEDPTVNEALRRLNQHLTDVEADGVKIEVGSYVGTKTYGSNNPIKLTFGFEPKLVILGMIAASNGGNCYGLTPGGGYWEDGFVWLKGQLYSLGSGNRNIYFTQTGKTLSWYGTYSAAEHQNLSGYTYRYIAIG